MDNCLDPPCNNGMAFADCVAKCRRKMQAIEGRQKQTNGLQLRLNCASDSLGKTFYQNSGSWIDAWTEWEGSEIRELDRELDGFGPIVWM
jgi:hypothetical protein